MRRVMFLFVPAALFCLVSAYAGLATADEAMEPLVGSHPANFDFRNRPPLPPDMKLSLWLRFARKNETEFRRHLQEMDDPSSPEYRHGLTPEEIHSRFGESMAEFQAVEQWLRSQGFGITEAIYGKSIDSIRFTGTVEQAEKAFRTTIVSTGPGKYANSTDAMIPHRFKGVIGSILGLDNFGGGFMIRPLARGQAELAAAGSAGLRAPNAIPEISIGGITAFAPADFHTFYDETPLLNAGINGTGTNCIALIEDSDFHDSAVNEFDSTFGVIAPNPNPIPRVSSHAIGFYNTDQSETLLDVEWAHAVAPGTPLKVYVENPMNFINSDQALLKALDNAVLDNTCAVISISYGNCNLNLDATSFDSDFSTARGQTQTVLVSAGDDGAAWHIENPDGSCGRVALPSDPNGGRNVNELAADPNVVSCGGTQFTPGMPGGNDQGFVPEFVWDEPTRPAGPGATGGGTSSIFAKPIWQKGFGVPPTANRDVPDVAMLGSPDMPGVFFFDYENGAPVLSPPVAGSSLCPPTWAGITSVVSEADSGVRQGFINPEIYLLGGLGGVIGFRDVLSGQNDFNGVTGFPANVGYDQSTGWGTPDITSFVNSQLFVSVYLRGCGGCTDSECAMGNSIAACQKYNSNTGKFTAVASMTYSRGYFPSVLLADGTTLLPGGLENILGYTYSESVVEIFNPSTGKVTSGPSMKDARAYHTGTRLDDGRVLVTGGLYSGLTALSSGELYDPVTNKWNLVSNNMSSARYDHTGTMLSDGRVLLTGGLNSTPAPLKTADVFDPIANKFSQVGSMANARRGHSAVLLPGGKVLITGGAANCTVLSSAELFDPSTNTFTSIGNMTHARSQHTSTLLPNGQVLIAGGASLNSSCDPVQLKSAELFNPTNNTFTAISGMNGARLRHAASVLQDGKVLIAGGFGGCSGATCYAGSSAEIYDPSAGTFTYTGSMPTASGGFAANPTH